MPIPGQLRQRGKIVSRRREEKDGGYPATVQGQYHYIHDLMQAVIDVPDQRGKGIFLLGAHVDCRAGKYLGHPRRGMKIYPRRVEKKAMHVKIRRYLIAREKYCRR